MHEIAASVLNADFSKWRKWLPGLESCGVQRIHWDVMDGRFVPNKGVTLGALKKFRPRTNIFFETHLMVLKPEKYLPALAQAGNQLAVFHVESTSTPIGVIQQIEEHGMKTGIAINNRTKPERVLPYLSEVDLCLVMSVEAGRGGQKFNAKSIQKMAALRKEIDHEGLACKIEVDGGINGKTAKKCVKAGADVLVAGTHIFRHKKGIAQAVKELGQI